MQKPQSFGKPKYSSVQTVHHTKTSKTAKGSSNKNVPEPQKFVTPQRQGKLEVRQTTKIKNPRRSA